MQQFLRADGLEQKFCSRRPVLTWTDDELGKAIFYHDRKLNEQFLWVFT
jgi:hypothetical protein